MDELRELLEVKLRGFLEKNDEMDMKAIKDAAAVLRELRVMDAPETADGPVGGVVELG